MPAKKSAKKAPAKKAAPRKASAKKPAPNRAAPKKAAVKKGVAKEAATSDVAWQDATLARVRTLIREALPEAVEEVKWRKPSNPDGVPTWSHGGLICTGETYKAYVKLTFAKGAFLPDPARLFNAGFGGDTRRAIDLREGDVLDGTAFKALVREAAALNASRK